jgi:hypothetical protein
MGKFMNASKSSAPSTDLTVTLTLARLLERLEHSQVQVDAQQYRSVVMHLVNEFSDVESNSALRTLLDAHPAAAELYENLNYQHAGLCRSPLEISLAAELKAKEVIDRIMRKSR